MLIIYAHSDCGALDHHWLREIGQRRKHKGAKLDAYQNISALQSQSLICALDVCGVLNQHWVARHRLHFGYQQQ